MTDQTLTNQTKDALPMKLDVTVRTFEPIGNLVGFADVKINDSLIVENFKVLKSDKGLFVGMPSKPDKSSETGYRDTVKPISKGFFKQLSGAVLGAYAAEINRKQTLSQGQERPSVMEQLKVGAEKAALENAAHLPKEKPAKAVGR